jgi:hypothetical protein
MTWKTIRVDGAQKRIWRIEQTPHLSVLLEHAARTHQQRLSNMSPIREVRQQVQTPRNPAVLTDPYERRPFLELPILDKAELASLIARASSPVF